MMILDKRDISEKGEFRIENLLGVQKKKKRIENLLQIQKLLRRLVR